LREFVLDAADLNASVTEIERRDAAPAMEASPACFHCGAPCRGEVFHAGERAFCCHGCQTVFEILTASGLDEYYQLGETAGVRVHGPARAEQFKFLDEPAVRERLVDYGDARRTRVTFHVPTIHCLACVWLLENLFRLKPGLGPSRVDFLRKEVSLAFDPARVKLSEVVALLASLGYEPELKLSALEARPRRSGKRRLWIQLGVAGFAFGNIMLFSIATYLGLDAITGPGFRRLTGWISLLLALPVVVYSARDYWQAAGTALRRRMLNLDVPITAGVAALFAQSSYEVLAGRGAGYFDSLTGLIFFLLVGRWFQQKTYDRLAFDRDYKSFFPLSVTRLGKRRGLPGHSIGAKTGDEAQTNHRQSKVGQSLLTSAATEFIEEHISLAQLAVGDWLIIRNGELIPADAKLVGGPALIDYSFVTGESEPVAKKPEDYLYAGGRQLGGAIEVETVKAVSQSYLTSLWNQEAFHKEKSGMLSTLTDRYSRHFTWSVMAFAVGVALFWAWANPALALKSFTSVLIVACPCALALAAPFALGTAQRLLAGRNVYLKSPRVLETLARVDAVVFDKTGTLTAAGAGCVQWMGGEHTTSNIQHPTSKESTAGEPTEIGRSSGKSAGGALTESEERWLYSLTRHSTHPLAVRIGEAIAREHFPDPVRSFLETDGAGLEGQVAGHEIWMGSAAWLESRGVAVCRKPGLPGRSIGAKTGDEAQKPGSDKLETPHVGSHVHVAINGRYRGGFVLTNALRPEVNQLVAGLNDRYEMSLLSGDNEKERGRFEPLFGCAAELRFTQSPLDKLNFIRRRQQSGRTVMMVGDGLNDAGALKQSDVGVAVVENVSAFSPASDVILAAEMVPRLAEVLRYAKQSVRVVQAAFVISVFYNVVGVGIAAGGRLSPVISAVLMPLSSVSVVAFACGATAWLGRRLKAPEVRP
jgi:P-type Cu+ transporter